MELPDQTAFRAHCKLLIQRLEHFSPSAQELRAKMSQITPFDSTHYPCFIQRWAVADKNAVFLFSNGSWQINFQDHQKLIVQYPDHLLAVDTSNSSCDDSGFTNGEGIASVNLDTSFRMWVSSHPRLSVVLEKLLFSLFWMVQIVLLMQQTQKV